MTTLINVPHFTFEQGDIFAEENPSERPIEVKYYNGSISIEQGGNEVIILPEYLDKLFREIKKHKLDAEYMLKNRT